HLGDLEGVREAGTDEVVARGAEHLGLGAEPAQRRGVHDARTVPLERGPLLALGGLVDPPFTIGGGVAVLGGSWGVVVGHRLNPSHRGVLRPYPSQPYPFTAPAVRPPTMYFCRNRNRSTTGIAEITAPAANRPHWTSSRSETHP